MNETVEHPSPHTSDAVALTPLQRRAIEIGVADAFLVAMTERLGPDIASQVFQDAVDRLASAAADTLREGGAVPGLPGLWEVWGLLGGDGRLDTQLTQLSDDALRFTVTKCAYAELYRSLGLETTGVAFSCRRDAPFARALVPGVVVEQSRTILEGNDRCEFTYTLEADR